MALGQIQIGQLSVSKLIIGGNPFSGFSHQSSERDLEMKRYYTTDRIKQTLRQAEQLGINTHIGRADHHIMRVLLEYWDEGGRIQWIAQTCPELGSIEAGITNAIEGEAKACFIHGGYMDFLFAQNKLDEAIDGVARVKATGMPVGIAGHNPEVFEWAEQHLDVDFYMCSYYNPTPRDEQPEHVSGSTEWFRPEDCDRMARLIQTLGKPVIHYKVLAAGRNTPKEAFAFVARHLRPQDAVCVGVHTRDNPEMLEEDLLLLEDNLQ
jgi:hypothetical protein